MSWEWHLGFLSGWTVLNKLPISLINVDSVFAWIFLAHDNGQSHNGIECLLWWVMTVFCTHFIYVQCCIFIELTVDCQIQFQMLCVNSGVFSLQILFWKFVFTVSIIIIMDWLLWCYWYFYGFLTHCGLIMQFDVNSLGPGRFQFNFRNQVVNFQANFSEWWLRYLLRNYPQVNTNIPYWWLVNIGSSNGLVPPGNKPWANVDPDLCRQMASLGLSELNGINMINYM